MLSLLYCHVSFKGREIRKLGTNRAIVSPFPAMDVAALVSGLGKKVKRSRRIDGALKSNDGFILPDCIIVPRDP